MAKLLFIMLASLSISINVLLGKNTCSHYDDEACVLPSMTKNGYYANQWTIFTPELTKLDVKQLMENNGFVYLGLIMDNSHMHLVTKNGTKEKHVMPNFSIIQQLKNLEQVKFVTQKYMYDDSPDIIYSVQDSNDVVCQNINPDEIVLNDGKENLKLVVLDIQNRKGNNKIPVVAKPELNKMPMANNDYFNDYDSNELTSVIDHDKNKV